MVGRGKIQDNANDNILTELLHSAPSIFKTEIIQTLKEVNKLFKKNEKELKTVYTELGKSLVKIAVSELIKITKKQEWIIRRMTGKLKKIEPIR